MNKNFIMAYSCGKDSTLALYKMIEKGYKPKCLLVTTRDGEESWFHNVPRDLVENVGQALGIDVLFKVCSIENYEEAFVEALKEGKETYNCEICVFGDIDIENHKAWDLEMCKRAGLRGELPLWKEDRRKLTFEFIDRGFKGIIKKLDLTILNKDFLGEKLTRDLALEIEKSGADMCGENGEYHTFVYDGPIFKNEVKFKALEKGKNNNYGYLKIEGSKNEN